MSPTRTETADERACDVCDAPGCHDESCAAVRALNTDWFVVDLSGKLLVARYEEMWFPGGQRRRYLVHYTFGAFKAKHARMRWQVSETRWITLGEAWLRWPDRRQYDRVVFAPGQPHQSDAEGVLNLWQGWPIHPRPGDWSVIRRHIEEVVCSGNCEWSEYLLNWIARLVQRPDQPGQVALALRGKEGTGKSILGWAIRRMVGQHGLAVSNAKFVTGHFNAHLRDVIFLQSDEAFYAGDPTQRNVLKALITDDMLTIELKGVDAFTVPNYLHLLITSNEEWTVPAGPESRRFLVLDVSNQRRGDRAYFDALAKAIADDAVIAAMLDDLLARDISTFRVEDFPDTPALREQRELSLTGFLAWAHDLAERGALGGAGFEEPWAEEVATRRLRADYLEWRRRTDRHVAARELPAETFGRSLRSVLGLEAVKHARGDQERRPGYRLGPVEEFRALVAERSGTNAPEGG